MPTAFDGIVAALSPGDGDARATKPVPLIAPALLRLALVVTGVSAVALALLSLAWPWGPDQAIMVHVARVWLDGGAPFKDAIDHKGPYAFVPFVVGEMVGRGSMAGIRIVDLAAIAATMALAGRSIARLMGHTVALWTGAIILAWCFRITYGEVAQPDEWVALASAVLFLRRMETPGRDDGLAVWGIGVLAGIGVLVKPFYLGIAAFPLFTMLVATRETRGSLAACAVRVGLGAAIPVLAMGAHLAARGALDDMFEIYLGAVNLAYRGAAADRPLSYHPSGLASFFLRKSWMVPLLPLLLLGLHELRRGQARLGVMVATWFAAGLALVVLQGRYFAYHFFVLMPPMAILVAVALDAAGRQLPSTTPPIVRAGLRLAPALALVYAASIASRPVRDAVAIMEELRGGSGLVEAIRVTQLRSGLSAGYARGERLAESLAQRGQRDQEVGLFIYDPTPLLLAQVRPASRLFVISPAYTRRNAYGDSVLTSYANELARERPEYIVVDCWLSWESEEKSYPTVSPSFVALLARSYRLDEDVDGLRLYRARHAGDAPVAPVSPDSICPRR
ncbi:MAG: hypothetical protein MUE41_14190 [Gemmatimonadaceae bacterium]|nr:hypothetical protein [Gemmatimonadaceae bacterium]